MLEPLISCMQRFSSDPNFKADLNIIKWDDHSKIVEGNIVQSCVHHADWKFPQWFHQNLSLHQSLSKYSQIEKATKSNWDHKVQIGNRGMEGVREGGREGGKEGLKALYLLPFSCLLEPVKSSNQKMWHLLGQACKENKLRELLNGACVRFCKSFKGSGIFA